MLLRQRDTYSPSMSDLGFLLVQEIHENVVELEFLKIAALEFPEDCSSSSSAASSSEEPDHLDHHHQEQESSTEEDEDKERSLQEKPDEVPASTGKRRTPPLLGEFEVEDDDDGFRTPTSAEQRIPIATTCPPAPKKPKPEATLPVKRTQIRCRRVLQFDKLGSIFPKRREPHSQRNVKRGRREDESDSS